MQKNKNILSIILILLISACNFIYADPPNWDENGDGVLDNFNDYENNGSITASVFSNDINVGDDGDMIAAFVNGEQRGVGLATLTPFGPYIDTYQFQIMIYSNATNGENITFQFYDSSQNQVYFLDQTLEFTTNMIVGDVFNPYLFTFTIDNTDDILGCTDPFACNYSPEATVNDGSCEYPENNYNCAGDCIVEIDCEGNCGGGSIEDPCGICNGNGSTCAGCIDNLACNYDSNAILDDGSCEYSEENFDCDGNCIAEIDCEGNCGGSAIIDECGECNGPGIIDGFCDCNENILDCNNNCGGEAYIDNCGDCVGGDTNNLECESFSYEIPLHIGSNLISFHALPVDNSVENILIEDSNDFIYSIISETNSAINTGETWIGSLNEMNNIDGYWFQNINSMNLVINDTYNIDNNIVYNLHAGANLVSFPYYQYSLDISDVLNGYEQYFDAIIGESQAYVQFDNGEWVGTLTTFEGNHGYWFILNDDLEFSYNTNRLISNIENNKNEILHCQSSLQSFYFIQNINTLDLIEGDWILAYKGDALVGSRKYNNQEIVDIPVMGNDNFDTSKDYCNLGDQINFKIKKISGEIIDLNGNIPRWKDMSIEFIDLFHDYNNFPTKFELSNIYPNPFNPMVNFDLSIDINTEDISIDVYNINGQLVDNIYAGPLNKGYHNYSWNASKFSSGIYFIKVFSEQHLISKKVSLIK